jgi:hypothetical protein
VTGHEYERDEPDELELNAETVSDLELTDDDSDEVRGAGCNPCTNRSIVTQ